MPGGVSVAPPGRLGPLPAAGLALPTPRLLMVRPPPAPRRPPRPPAPPLPALPQSLHRNKPTQPLRSAPPLVCHAQRLLREASRCLPQLRREQEAAAAGAEGAAAALRLSPVSDALGTRAAAAAPEQLFPPFIFL